MDGNLPYSNWLNHLCSVNWLSTGGGRNAQGCIDPVLLGRKTKAWNKSPEGCHNWPTNRCWDLCLELPSKQEKKVIYYIFQVLMNRINVPWTHWFPPSSSSPPLPYDSDPSSVSLPGLLMDRHTSSLSRKNGPLLRMITRTHVTPWKYRIISHLFLLWGEFKGQIPTPICGVGCNTLTDTYSTAFLSSNCVMGQCSPVHFVQPVDCSWGQI